MVVPSGPKKCFANYSDCREALYKCKWTECKCKYEKHLGCGEFYCSKCMDDYEIPSKWIDTYNRKTKKTKRKITYEGYREQREVCIYCLLECDDHKDIETRNPEKMTLE